MRLCSELWDGYDKGGLRERKGWRTDGEIGMEIKDEEVGREETERGQRRTVM